MKRKFEKFLKFLHSRHLKNTRARRLIFEEVFSCPLVHPNAYEIHRHLEEKGYRVSLASIYRTLNLLVRSGLVREIDFGENHSHFEPERPRAGHGHLVCLACGQVREFSHARIQSVIHKIGKEKGFEMDKFSIQVFGYCRKCRKQ